MLDTVEKLTLIGDKELGVRSMASVEQVGAQGALITKIANDSTSPIPVTTENKFGTNNIDKTTTTNTVYIGAEDKDGAYKITRINTSTLVFDYATILNNPTQATYSTAWTNRVTLTYNLYSVAL